MAVKKTPFSWILGKDAAAATDELVSQVVRPGQLYCVQHASFRNKTSATTRLTIVVRSGAREVEIGEEDTLTAAKLYWYDVPFYLTEGERLVMKLTGLTGGDDLMGYVAGWYQTGQDVG